MPIAFLLHLIKNKRLYQVKIKYIKKMTQKSEKNNLISIIKKAGKWAPLVGGAWIVLNIVVPLALLRIPAVQKYLVVLEEKLPFDIPGIG